MRKKMFGIVRSTSGLSNQKEAKKTACYVKQSNFDGLTQLVGNKINEN